MNVRIVTCEGLVISLTFPQCLIHKRASKKKDQGSPKVIEFTILYPNSKLYDSSDINIPRFPALILC